MAPTRPTIPVSSIGDPRIAVYRNLKDRDLSREGNRFIAEGELVVRRLLESDFPCESVLLAERRVAEIAPLVPPHVPIFTGPADVVHQIVGFKFHAGVMAVGVRKPPLSLETLASEWTDQDGDVTLVVCPEISNTENLGSLVRIAAGFGATAMVLGQHCCDPFYRQSVRVSMGTIFRLPIVQSRDLLGDLIQMKQRWGVETIATVCQHDAEPLARAPRSKLIAILFGNEAQGLGAHYIAACDRRVTIPMQLGTDSLNVSVAAGVVMYHFTQHVRV